MALAQIKQVEGRGVYVPGDDIDTDQITPARFLMCVTFDGLGKALFYDARFGRDGASKGHPLDDPRFAGASVLLANKNFGCGSSREHAPQAFHKAGFRAIIAESFAEIFFGNATTLGIPCVSLARTEIEELARAIAADPALVITVDVEHGEVRAGSRRYRCQLKQSARDALVHGEWDSIAQLLESREAVLALNEALDQLSDYSTRLAQLVEYRFFGGLTYDEIASVTGMSVPTVKRDWARARAWLFRAMQPDGHPLPSTS